MEKRIVGGIELRQDGDGRWLDENGTEFVLEDDAAIGDPITRCGVGPLSLPQESEWTDACRAHDFEFGSIRYMETHKRSEADRALLSRMLIIAGDNPAKKAAAYAMYGVSRALGWYWWDVRATRWQ
jgi:hypothetical protein